MQKDLKPGSKLSDKLEVLSILVEAYEKELTSILGGRRKLSLTMIRELHDKLKIPAETLIAVY